jgi:hypothetical protein
MELPKPRLGRETRTKTIDGKPMIYKVIDEDCFLASSNPRKAFCLHKLRFEDGRERFRIGYYMIAVKPRMRGKWAWGQFAPIMTGQEMKMIYERVKKKGWLRARAKQPPERDRKGD